VSRRVVVTGGARGIGAAIAEAFRTQGEAVLALDRDVPAEPLAGVRYGTVDVSDPGSVEAAFAEIDRVDVLVNNAGIQRVGLVGRQPAEEWLSVVATNLSGAYLCSAQAIPRMPDGGAIVSIASAAAFVGLPGRSAYSAAKAGLLGLTRTMGVELAPRRIRVNAVCPGFTRTAFIQQGIEDGSLDLGWMMQRVPYGRMAEPREIADAVCYLAGEQASYVTGQALVVDGGWTVQGIGAAPEWLST
jgi:NAD(P)-dependent dehydrogenase (short-subunit alcohol dehydrogenase family)